MHEQGEGIGLKIRQNCIFQFHCEQNMVAEPLGRTQNPTVCHRHLAQHCSISCYKSYRRSVPFRDNSRTFSRP